MASFRKKHILKIAKSAVFLIFDKRISDGHFIESHNSMEMQQVHLPATFLTKDKPVRER
jgi:hypothetical protein